MGSRDSKTKRFNAFNFYLHTNASFDGRSGLQKRNKERIIKGLYAGVLEKGKYYFLFEGLSMCVKLGRLVLMRE